MSDVEKNVQARLFELQDLKYRDFNSKLIPTVDPETVIGVRTPELREQIKTWMASDHTYTIRFGMEMLMSFFLDEQFQPEYLEWVAGVKSEEYYVNMMVAWYFATALAKQYDATLPYIQQCRLEPWTHNKAIQKAIESYRITDEQKAYLRSLKVKAK